MIVDHWRYPCKWFSFKRSHDKTLAYLVCHIKTNLKKKKLKIYISYWTTNADVKTLK